MIQQTPFSLPEFIYSKRQIDWWEVGLECWIALKRGLYARRSFQCTLYKKELGKRERSWKVVLWMRTFLWVVGDVFYQTKRSEQVSKTSKVHEEARGVCSGIGSPLRISYKETIIIGMDTQTIQGRGLHLLTCISGCHVNETLSWELSGLSCPVPGQGSPDNCWCSWWQVTSTSVPQGISFLDKPGLGANQSSCLLKRLKKRGSRSK